MKRRSRIRRAIVFAIACLFFARSGTSEEGTARLNVILIVIDTLRADHLSTYGYPKPTSPNIDQLAAEGVLYEKSISASSWTLPAHASLFTGLFPRDHQTTSQQWELKESFETLAEILNAAGYHTGGFSNNVWTDDFSGLTQGFDTFEQLWKFRKAEKGRMSRDDPSTDMYGAQTTETVFRWVDGLADESPFFVFINYYEPHLPYRPTQPFDDDFLPQGVSQQDILRLRSFRSPREYGYILEAPWMKVSDREIEILAGLYDGEIAYIDSVIGKLVDNLRSRELLDDTLIVLTSDHGEHLGENHMLSHKLSVYEPLLHVPLILRNPKRIPSGKRIETLVQAHDAFGSILELTGARRNVDRTLPFDDRPSEYVFSQLAYPEIFLKVVEKEIPGWDRSRFERALDVVRGDRYKLISGSDGSVELYDLVADPLETTNLSTTEPRILEEMQQALQAFRRSELPSR